MSNVNTLQFAETQGSLILSMMIKKFPIILLTYGPTKYIIILGSKSKEVFLLSPNKKMGRPTDNPKRHSVKARVDDETFRILNAYCKSKGKSIAAGIRDGIRKLEPDI